VRGCEFCQNQHSGSRTTGCPTRYRTRHFFNNFTTNEDIATKFEADLAHCVRNATEKNVLLYKFRCIIFTGVRIIKEMPGLVAIGTLCIFRGIQKFLSVLATLIVRSGSNPVHIMCMLLRMCEICKDRHREGRNLLMGANINIFACTVKRYHVVKESSCVTRNIDHFAILFNPLNAELNPICDLLALLGAHHFLHVSRIRVKSLTLRLLMPYIYMTLVA
jgi:hypothetical protein